MLRFQPKINSNSIDSTLQWYFINITFAPSVNVGSMVNKKKINGNAIESTLHHDWFYVTDAESVLKLTKNNHW